MNTGAPAVCAAHNSNRNFIAPAAKIPKPTWEELFPNFQEKKMKKMLLRFGLPSILLLAMGLVAIAGSPHFIGNLTNASLNSTGGLVVSFKEAGLESGATEFITASATATAAWFCVNNGSKNPAATNKQTSSSTVTGSGEFTADRNGNVIGAVTIDPPLLPSGFSCPNGQDLELGSVSYTVVSISDGTSGAFLNIDGTFSTGCLLTGVTFKKGTTCTP